MNYSNTEKIYIYALLIITSFLFFFPLFWAISASFSPNTYIFKHLFPFTLKALIPLEFTTDAYVNLWARDFDLAIRNSIILSVVGTLGGGIISSTAGFAFGRFEFFGKNIIFGTVLLSFMVPADMLAIPTFILVTELGWSNTWQGLLVPSLAHSLAIFLFTQFFKGIPQEMIDAAKVDGASWFRIFVSIAIPISKPVMLSAGLLLFIFQWTAFFWPLLIAPSPGLRVIQVAISQAVLDYNVQWNELLAGATLAAAIPILLILPFQKYYIEGVSGSIKG
ncbi:MAG: carbohydrate ABC transporter permease [SAR324 cluster bacterium]|nr:carbohydrate ABC transporter permease [SAR324 cluster bacterium]